MTNQKTNIVYPDYNNSIINLISTIMNVYGVKSEYPPLKQINIDKLGKKKNIILMIFDGLGYELLKSYSSNASSFMYDHLLDHITSVFPPTTTAAITSLMTCESPLEHGALGWTLYFKEYSKYIDILPGIDDITGKSLNSKHYKIMQIMGINNLFNIIHKENPDISLDKIMPEYLINSDYSEQISYPAKVIPYSSIKNLFRVVSDRTLNDNNEKKLIIAYSTNPDGLEHKNGTDSIEVANFIYKIDEYIKELCNNLRNTDTSLLITADHGLINVNKYYYTNEITELYDCMIMPTFPEPRFLTFHLKKHKISKFETIIDKYRDKFLVLNRKEFMESGLLGRGKQHKKIDDFIGDYVAISISDTAMKTIFQQKGKEKNEFKAHHSGLTREEMLVPLIEIDI